MIEIEPLRDSNVTSALGANNDNAHCVGSPPCWGTGARDRLIESAGDRRYILDETPETGLLGFGAGGLDSVPVRATQRLFALLAAGLLGLITLTACEPIELDSGGEVVRNAPVVEAVTTAELDALTVAGWVAMTGYSRDRFPHWVSQGNSCDTREVVLQRDGTGVAVGEDCRATGGEWFSPYDGKTFGDPGDLDIDHMVPLANAWRTGAAAWTDEQRQAFANDLSRPQLIAVSASSNRSKGDQDPSQWRPPREEYWCTYARAWITVKAHWQLWITVDEKTALAEMLGTC